MEIDRLLTKHFCGEPLTTTEVSEIASVLRFPNSRDSQHVASAVDLAGRFELNDLREAIERLTTSEHAIVRCAAFHALVNQWGDAERYRKLVVAALESDDFDLRLKAIRAAGRLAADGKDEDCVERLIVMLEEPAEEFHQPVYEALMRAVGLPSDQLTTLNRRERLHTISADGFGVLTKLGR